MVSLASLLLPILGASVLVFLASAIVHMMLPWHKSDMAQLPDEEKVLAAVREAGPAPGDYFFPYAEQSEMRSPETLERFERGPVGVVTIRPSGMPSMGAALVQWFVYLLVINVFVAYVTGRVVAPGTEYLAVFRVAGTIAFLAYAGAEAHQSIWWGRRWSTTLKNMIDGLFYGLLTAGMFGWLWPGM